MASPAYLARPIFVHYGLSLARWKWRLARLRKSDVVILGCRLPSGVMGFVEEASSQTTGGTYWGWVRLDVNGAEVLKARTVFGQGRSRAIADLGGEFDVVVNPQGGEFRVHFDKSSGPALIEIFGASGRSQTMPPVPAWMRVSGSCRVMGGDCVEHESGLWLLQVPPDDTSAEEMSEGDERRRRGCLGAVGLSRFQPRRLRRQ